MHTIGDVIATVRTLLQDKDADSFRVSDGDIALFYNAAIVEVRRARPDLFVGALGSDVAQAKTDGTEPLANPIATPDWLFMALVYFICAHIEMMDMEQQSMARAQIYSQSFLGEIR